MDEYKRRREPCWVGWSLIKWDDIERKQNIYTPRFHITTPIGWPQMAINQVNRSTIDDRTVDIPIRIMDHSTYLHPQMGPRTLRRVCQRYMYPGRISYDGRHRYKYQIEVYVDSKNDGERMVCTPWCESNKWNQTSSIRVGIRTYIAYTQWRQYNHTAGWRTRYNQT